MHQIVTRLTKKSTALKEKQTLQNSKVKRNKTESFRYQISLWKVNMFNLRT